MRQGIPGWVVPLTLFGIFFLYKSVSETMEMNNYKSTFPFNVDSLQRIVSLNFSYYVEQDEKLTKGACFIFNIKDGQLTVNKPAIELLPNNISPKHNKLRIVAIVEEHEISSGRYTNGGSGILHCSNVYFYDCIKGKVIRKEEICGSQPPSSGYVRSGGRLSGSKVTKEDIAKLVKSLLN